jgi:hypothetical protein
MYPGGVRPRPTLAALALLAALGCRPAAKVEAPASEAANAAHVDDARARARPDSATPDQPLELASFDTFLGLRLGDTRADAIARFGEPVYVDRDADFDSLYFVLIEDRLADDGPPGLGDEYLFVVRSDNGTNKVFNIQAMLGDYAEQGIHDPRLRLLGVHLDEITAGLGNPTHSHAGFNTYEYVDDERGLSIEVEFVCYEHDGLRCTEIWVSWFDARWY